MSKEKVSEEKQKKPKKTEELEKLETELAETKDRLLRLMAEFENFKKRTEREKEEQSAYVICETILQLLPAVDSLEMAIKAENASAEDMKKGIELTLAQFSAGLAKLGIEPIDTEGGFNPELHSAIMHTESKDYPENSVMEVYQKGYKTANRVIRHSVVSVAN